MNQRADSPEPRAGIYQCGTLTYTKPALAVLFFWLLWGDFCYVLMESVVPSIIPLRFKALGATNTTMGVVLSTLPWLISLVLNPVISFRSDRCRSRWGRRIPFILFSLPFLVGCLIALGFGEQIGLWVNHQWNGWLGGMSPQSTAIAVISVILVAFTVFNTFVNSVFWYLFNDVVPEHLLARFMSWFRVVSTISASLYNLLIFRFADTHATEILVGTGLLYFVGFGLMCLNVKEGKYPQVPNFIDNRPGFVSAVKTYFSECLSLPHYWYQFLATFFSAMAFSAVMFMVFFYQSTGLGVAEIGQINGWINIEVSVLILGSGWLADRFHPIRVCLLGQVLLVFAAIPASMIWMVWHPVPRTAFWVWMLISLVLTAPTTALLGVWDPPLFMRLFPRDRYGQFCSANSIWRAAGIIIGGVFTGMFLDHMKHFASPADVYRFIPIWQFVCQLPVLILLIKLYQSWKRYGGDVSYKPPLPYMSLDPAGGESVTNRVRN
ncbi:MAG: MFS transporter [Verrucomicrobiota bacterium]